MEGSQDKPIEVSSSDSESEPELSSGQYILVPRTPPSCTIDDGDVKGVPPTFPVDTLDSEEEEEDPHRRVGLEGWEDDPSKETAYAETYERLERQGVLNYLPNQLPHPDTLRTLLEQRSAVKKAREEAKAEIVSLRKQREAMDFKLALQRSILTDLGEDIGEGKDNKDDNSAVLSSSEGSTDDEEESSSSSSDASDGDDELEDKRSSDDDPMSEEEEPAEPDTVEETVCTPVVDAPQPPLDQGSLIDYGDVFTEFLSSRIDLNADVEVLGVARLSFNLTLNPNSEPPCRLS